MKILMSKSEYLSFVQHPKILWLNKYLRKEKDPISEVEERIFSTGSEIGEMAWLKYNDKAVEIERMGVEFDVIATKQLMTKAQHNITGEIIHTETLPVGYEWVFNTFFEPCFIDKNGFYCYCDIIYRDGAGFSLVEVKSTSKVKPYHMHDIAFQYNILVNNGIKLVSQNIAHLNTDYQLNKKMDWDELFVQEDVSSKLEKYMASTLNLKKMAQDFLYENINLYSSNKLEIVVRDFIKSKNKNEDIYAFIESHGCKVTSKINEIIEEYFNLLELTFDTYFNLYLPAKVSDLLASKEEPKAELGSWLKYPNSCGFIEYLTKDLPKNHIYFLGSGTGIKAGEKKQLQLRGINLIPNITNKIIKEYKFSPEQIVEIKEHKRIASGKPSKVWANKKGFKEHFSQLVFPLSYLDFETVSPVLPLFSGARPHQRLIFQYSLHIQDRRGSITAHKEFLFSPSKKNKDPELMLVERMIEDLPKTGTIVVYYADFEKTCIRNLAERFPQYKEQLDSILERIWDLYEPFEKRFHYNIEQKGSASIKKILPLFTNERSGFSYKDLVVQNGLEATMLYGDYLEGKMSFKNKQEELKFRSDLLDYCKLDTLAMVMILTAINERLNLKLFKNE